jgi:ATP phosphoribosyltransferase regulatory subunit HisZ
MALFDDILGKVSGHPELENLAAKVGIDPKMAEQLVAALGEAHQLPGDTVQQAAAKTGLDAGIVGQVVEHIGGEGSLGRFASMIDQDGDGNPLDELAGFAGKLFGKG